MFRYNKKYMESLKAQVKELQEQNLILINNLDNMKNEIVKREIELEKKEKSLDKLIDTYKQNIAELDKLKVKLRGLISDAKNQAKIASKSMKSQVDRIKKVKTAD